MNNLLRVDPNAACFSRAMAKAIESRPLVRPSVQFDGCSSYDVRRSDGISFAVVKFLRSPDGCALACCDCPGGDAGRFCYHVAAALIAHVWLVRAGLRVSVSRSVWVPRSSGRGWVARAA
jgi:hypothetical protein